MAGSFWKGIVVETLEVSHEPTYSLNAVAYQKIPAIVVTREVSHETIAPLNEKAPKQHGPSEYLKVL
jgi:hypothetical protein